jgi:hypothetical protein
MSQLAELAPAEIDRSAQEAAKIPVEPPKRGQDERYLVYRPTPRSRPNMPFLCWQKFGDP